MSSKFLLFAFLVFLFPIDPQAHLESIDRIDSDLIRLTQLKEQILTECYPDLREFDIQLVPYKEEGYFFETTVRHPLARRHSRTYVVKYNPELFRLQIPEHPLAAILAHELGHIADYSQMSGGQLIQLGINYLFSKKFRMKYERQTDLKVLERGLGPWLVEYREWLYEQLDPKTVLKRKRTYMTPDEIAVWVQDNPTRPCLSSL